MNIMAQFMKNQTNGAISQFGEHINSLGQDFKNISELENSINRFFSQIFEQTVDFGLNCFCNI